MPIEPPQWSASSNSDVHDILEREHIEFAHVGLFDTEGVLREKR